MSRTRWLGALALLAAACSGKPGTSMRPPPRVLSDTGLYADAASRTLSDDVVAFTPAYELWSDGAQKARWLSLPPRTSIDTRAADHFVFPVGTRAWKEFRRGGRRLETRFIERTGPGPNDYFMGAFVWNEAGTEAVLDADGAADVLGTDHDVPAAERCASCHGGERGRLLGFSAVQLGFGPSASVLRALDVQGRLSHGVPAPSATLKAVPEARDALGRLHANCGHCHAETGLAFRDVDLVLRLDVATASLSDSGLYRTAVGRRMLRPADGPTLRVDPGRPETSGLVYRMRSRAPDAQMPPLGTEHPDTAGVAALSGLIARLPHTPSD